MKVSFRLSSPDASPAPAADYTVVADVYQFRKNGPRLFLGNYPITISRHPQLNSVLDLPDGSYQVTLNFGDGRSAVVSVDDSVPEVKGGLKVCEVTVAGPTNIEHVLPKGRRQVASFEAFRALGSAVASFGSTHGPSAVPDSDDGVFDIDVVVTPTRDFLQYLNRDDLHTREMAAAYLGFVTGIQLPGRSLARSPQLNQHAFALAGPALALTEHMSPKQKRFALLSLSGKSLDSVTFRPDLEVKGAEKFTVSREVDAEGRRRPLLKTEDSRLDAILRFQCLGDMRGAMSIADFEGQKRLDPVEHPLWSLASAYTMSSRLVSDAKVVKSIPWLDELEVQMPSLPDPQIIQAALLVCRDWSSLKRDSRLADKEHREERAYTLAFEALSKGPPAFRFGFPLLSDVFAMLSVSRNERMAGLSQMAKRTSALMAWFSTRVDVSQGCTSIRLW